MGRSDMAMSWFAVLDISGFSRSPWIEIGWGINILALFGSWLGHAYLLTTILNVLYSQPIPKLYLRIARFIVGGLVLLFPIIPYATFRVESISPILTLYLLLCVFLGIVVYPLVVLYRYFQRLPSMVTDEKLETIDYLETLGESVIGDGKMHRFIRRLPTRHHVFRVDYSDLLLSPPEMPKEWDGLSILLLTDFHFHGTPAKAFYDAIIDRVNSGPEPDIVALAGDYVDTDKHRDWIGEVLGRLRWREAGLAVLGNHDVHHDPPKIRSELEAIGVHVLGNRWMSLSIRGHDCVVAGHEGPWIGRGPDLSDAPSEGFRLVVSHTPDQFFWAIRHRVNLLLCGHVHGGQIRLPLIGSMFVPSVFGRRFDMGVFERSGTVMVVSRGLGGKEPIRFRCNPQVIRITLAVTK